MNSMNSGDIMIIFGLVAIIIATATFMYFYFFSRKGGGSAQSSSGGSLNDFKRLEVKIALVVPRDQVSGLGKDPTPSELAREHVLRVLNGALENLDAKKIQMSSPSFGRQTRQFNLPIGCRLIIVVSILKIGTYAVEYLKVETSGKQVIMKNVTSDTGKIPIKSQPKIPEDMDELRKTFPHFITACIRTKRVRR